MKCPSLSLLTNLGLNSTLSKNCFYSLFRGDISMVNLLLPFHPKMVFVSVNKISFLYTTDFQVFLFIQFAKQCLLMGELSPLTSSVNIERYVLISAIYLFLLFKDLCVCSQFYATL
jgi:hypothetical protein